MPSAADPQIILFKLDDVHGVYPHNERVVAFALEEGIKINFGVFGSALESDDPAFVTWLETLKKTGLFEFWNHGYGGFGHPKENVGTGYEAQKQTIGRGQELSAQHLGEAFIAFGPHASAVDADTWRVLNERPEIKLVWCFGPPVGVTAAHAFVTEHRVGMESPVTKMNQAKFLVDYEKLGKDREYLVLQGHPNAWDDDMFQQFKDVTLFLKSKACRFMTISEFLATRTAK